MKQISFLPKPVLFHGGKLAKGRKCMRPLCTKRPLHLVIKAKQNILYRNKKSIENEVHRLSIKFRLKIYSTAVNFDHIHFVLRLHHRRDYRAFIRSLTAVLARKFGKGLWALAPFTRILSWGKDFRKVLAYLRQNCEEVAGIRPYGIRRDSYRRLVVH